MLPKPAGNDATAPPLRPATGVDGSTDAAGAIAPVAPPQWRHFLDGGGEMGERMRALDWSATPLGAPDGWPRSLKTTVRMMLDSRYAMWMAWGPEMTFLCNDAYLPTLGLKREWALGARSERVWAEVWDAAYSRIRHVLTTGEATWDEGLLLFLERSGFPEETYHTFSYSPAYDDALRVTGMLCVVTEVTDRVVGERRLRVLRDLAARTVGADDAAECARRTCEVLAEFPLDLPFAGLYLTEPDGRHAHRVGCAGERAAGQLPARLSLVDPPDGWPLRALYGGEAAQALPSLAALGIGIDLPPWPERVERAVLLPLKSPGKEPAGFLVAGLSPRRPDDEASRAFLRLVAGQVAAALADAMAYEAERRRAEALAELDRAKTAFFSNVSHEFRTPLTLMLGPLEELLTAPGLDAPQRDRLALALRNAGRLQRLVNTLLDFSRIEAGRALARYEATDLAALTRDLASTFRSAMERAGLDFVVDCPALPEPVFVDREMWEKVVLNLLSNAFKFTLRGAVTVRLRAQGHDPREAMLEVADTGTGIPPDELPRVFERFHRVAGAEGRSHEGSGIGLALVQELVKLHGGHIEAASVMGEGSLFRVRVPLGSAHLPAERIETARAAAQAPASTTGARAYVEEALRWLPMPDIAPPAADVTGAQPAPDRRFAPNFGARVLLADDNADMRGYLRDLLSPYYAVEVVADGLQALEAARREPPALIVSDVMMPRLDGLALLGAIRADERLGGVPVVLLSARAGEEARIEGLDAGADDYLIKPFSARELLARLGALLELRRMRQAAEAAFRLRTEQFETLLNEAPLGVFLVAHDGTAFRMREANPTARASFGNAPDLLDRRFDELVARQWGHPLADQIVALFARTWATGEPYYTPEFIQARSDLGTTEAYEWQINRIPLPDGSAGVVCYFREISAHLKARRRLEAADRQKDQFLAMLAHELRNPIAPIRSAGDVLARLGLPDERSRQMVAIIRRQVETLTRLVDDLLDISRITEGRIELQLTPVMLPEVIAQAVETVEPLMREKRHRFSVSAGRPLVVRADQARLVQCVANVLTNAAKYTDPEGRIELSVNAEQPPTPSDGGMAVIRIRDDGVGIPPDLQATMFDLFVQGDRTLDRSQGGLGIGLSLVRRLIEMHGGRVDATSDGIGTGASFELRVPLLTAPGSSGPG
ncbi:ATP-binding protein [Roseateles chitosanitabidus]|uniref:ATP-binding protein n=1 Tax=Roseateles chitosanitabidus TaxID=65048 RepID=UPI000836D96E|nr:ATP-binding protein [Roseateles chitosanitabidus]